MGKASLFAPHEDASLGALGGEGVQRGEMSSAVEEFWMRFFFWATDSDWRTPHDMRNRGCGIVEVADENGFSGANNNAGGFEADIQSMRAKIAFLGRVIFRVDENGVIWTGGDTCFTANAESLIEIDNTVRACLHGFGGARLDARWVFALIAPSNLEGAARMREDSDIDIFDVGAIDRERNLIFGFTCRAAGVASDAFRVVNDFRPFDWQCFGVEEFVH